MKIKFYLPQNVFSRILLSEIEDSSELESEFLPSSLISKSISADENSLGLMPTMDIISNKDLFITSEIGISFNALLSNAYIHFKEEQETIGELFLRGDVSSNEVILSKILFKEFYDVEIKTTLWNKDLPGMNENILIAGNENFDKGLFLNGLSFSEEIIELINAPYVNFVLASSSDELLKKFVKANKENFKKPHSEEFKNLYPAFPQTSLDFLSVNVQHLIFDFEEQDLEGIKQMLQMPYYHGMIKEMIDVKFV